MSMLKTFSLAEAKKVRLSVEDPVLITGPSGSGKDYLAREICHPDSVCSLDHIGYWTKGAGHQWVMDPAQVAKLIGCRKYKVFTGVSDSEIVWIHYFNRILIPWATLDTMRSVYKHKMEQRNRQRREDGKPEDAHTIWHEPNDLEKDCYIELYKPRPFGFKGMVARVINDRSAHKGHAWSEFNDPKEDDRKDVIRKLAGYTAEQYKLRKAKS